MAASDPKWINAVAGVPAYTAAELRRLDGAGWAKAGETDRFGARAGVVPAATPVLALSGTTVTVQDLQGVVYPGLTSQSGPYTVAHPSETHEVDPPDGTNPRVDIVVLRVYDDDEDSSGLRETRTEYIAGTPSGSPVTPTTPAGAVRLGYLNVPQNGGGSATLTVDAPLAVCAGGILPVPDDAALAAASGGLYDGSTRWRRDGDALEVHNGASAWETVASVGGYQRTVDPPTCRIYHNTTQSVNDATETVVVFNSERWDTDSMHSTSSNTSRITFTTAGLYLVGFHGVFQSGTDYIRAFVSVRLNGTTGIGRGSNPTTAAGPQVSVSTLWKFAQGDYIEFRVFQDNTASAARTLSSLASESPEAWAVYQGSGD